MIVFSSDPLEGFGNGMVPPAPGFGIGPVFAPPPVPRKPEPELMALLQIINEANGHLARAQELLSHLTATVGPAVGR